MNEKDSKINEELLSYQTLRLKGLIREIIQCCEDRKLYESQKFGLLYSELKCLMLFDGERYLTVKGIAERLEVAKSRVTKIINGLVEKRLVESINDPKDARIRLISLTQSGQKKSAEIEAFQQEIHRKLLLQMSIGERKNVLSHLESLRTAMEAVKEQLI
ncbi:MAG: MarR family transcriptional regulator [Desulfobacteraceae bacterium]|nr:MAG: MarR family transcriptional regulator [Desulfobacteraceae bacterium]